MSITTLPAKPITCNPSAAERISERINIHTPADSDLLALYATFGAPKCPKTFLGNYGLGRLKEMVTYHARTYEGGFKFMRDMRTVVESNNKLSYPQMAAILNTMIAAAKHHQEAQA